MAGRREDILAVAAHLEALPIADTTTRYEIDAVAARLYGIGVDGHQPDLNCNSLMGVDDTPPTIIEAARAVIAAHRIGSRARDTNGHQADCYGRLVEPTVEALAALLDRHTTRPSTPPPFGHLEPPGQWDSEGEPCCPKTVACEPHESHEVRLRHHPREQDFSHFTTRCSGYP